MVHVHRASPSTIAPAQSLRHSGFALAVFSPRAMSALSHFVSHLFINTRTDTIVGYES